MNREICTNCNVCTFSKKEQLEDVTDGAFKALCTIFFLKTSTAIKQRTVSFRAYKDLPITPPEWCPLKPENKDKPKVYDISKMYAENREKVEAEKAAAKKKREEEEAEEKKKAEAALPRKTAWKDITVGIDYVIPRIDLKPCKIVRVIEKDDKRLRVKEVEENGNVTIYVNLIYRDDVEAKLMSIYRSF